MSDHVPKGTGPAVREPLRFVEPQCCHFCEKKQKPGARVYVPRVTSDATGKPFTWEPPVIVCESCKGKPTRSTLLEAIVGGELVL